MVGGTARIGNSTVRVGKATRSSFLGTAQECLSFSGERERERTRSTFRPTVCATRNYEPGGFVVRSFGRPLAHFRTRYSLVLLLQRRQTLGVFPHSSNTQPTRSPKRTDLDPSRCLLKTLDSHQAAAISADKRSIHSISVWSCIQIESRTTCRNGLNW